MNYPKISHDKLTQFSTVNALLVGLYDGFFPVKHVCSQGNLGIGCSHTMDGEMILVDGECYIARANQKLNRMHMTEKIPFAQVAHFNPLFKSSISDVKNKEQLTKILLEKSRSSNLFIGFRVTGQFSKLRFRQPASTPSKPYPPMFEFFAKQKEIELESARGTLVGFWSPQQYQGTVVAGIHTHFVDEARCFGGHVIELYIQSGELEIQLYSHLEIRLPEDRDFLNADLSYEDIDAHIKHAES